MIRWLCNKIYWAGRNYDDAVPSLGRDAIVLDESISPDMGKAIKFSILPARGGCVFETRTFDPKQHEWDTITHVIPEGEDVAYAVGQLVAMEILKR